jgi:hypothetical protein
MRMRLILGMILGAVLTVVGAYIHDSGTSSSPSVPPPQTDGMPPPSDPAQGRPMVNWDVVAQEWGRLSTRAQAEWNKWTK